MTARTPVSPDGVEAARQRLRDYVPPPAMAAGAVDAVVLLTDLLYQRIFKGPGRDRRNEARAIAEQAVRLLRNEGLIPGTAERRPAGYGPSTEWQDRGEKPARGISHLLAEALVLLELDVVHRDTIKALLPSGDKVSAGLNRAIRKFDQFRWIVRTNDGLLRVLDPDALTNWFLEAEDLNEHRARTQFNLAAAISAINAGIDDPDADPDVALRRRELLAVKRLMEGAPGAVTNERGTRRLTHRPELL